MGILPKKILLATDGSRDAALAAMSAWSSPPATECRNLSGRALVASTGVTDERATQELARRAVENFGRIP